MEVRVQTQDFSLQAEYQALCEGNKQDGAVVTFCGRVRDRNEGRNIIALELEHYPAMTQKVLTNIVEEAKRRWSLGQVRVVHRIGKLALGEQIVFVGVTSTHRQDAFLAADFIMDFLKTQAPFWKKEHTGEGESWVEARASDQQQLQRWTTA